MTGTEKDASDLTNRQVAMIFLTLLGVIAVVVLAVVVFGAAVLGPIGILATLLIFAVLLAFTAGR